MEMICEPRCSAYENTWSLYRVANDTLLAIVFQQEDDDGQEDKLDELDMRSSTLSFECVGIHEEATSLNVFRPYQSSLNTTRIAI